MIRGHFTGVYPILSQKLRAIRYLSYTQHVCSWLLLVFVLVACVTPNDISPSELLVVSAASNLTLAFEEIGPLYQRQTGTRVIYNFAASGQLAHQIDQGAPVDLFLAANVAYVQDLAAKGRVLPDTVHIFARGRLTLWTRADSKLNVRTVQDLLSPEIGRIAIANPEHAPYGVTARQALQTAGIWDAMQSKLVMGENVRQTLQFAETGDVDVAVVPLSLSITSEGRWSLVPEDLHPAINQALGVVADSPRQAQARDFADFITGPHGREILRKYGFEPAREVNRP